jgi:hypothetical protein
MLKGGRADRGRGTEDRKRLEALKIKSMEELAYAWSYPPKKTNRTASFQATRLSHLDPWLSAPAFQWVRLFTGIS